jgi:hypothetical protein
MMQADVIEFSSILADLEPEEGLDLGGVGGHDVLRRSHLGGALNQRLL